MSSGKKGLGRGFESLIPTELIDETFDPTSAEDSKVSKLLDIPVDKIIPDENQPRRHFDQRALDELANSIKEFGILQPIVVTRNSNDTYTIVAGERRWRAGKAAGVKTVPAIVRTLNAQRKLETSLIENVHRKDLNVLEIATTYAKLRDQFNLSPEQIGVRVGGRSASTITNTLRLLRLPDSAKRALVAGQLTEGQARPLIMADHAVVERILPTIVTEGWSARKIEQFMVLLKSSRTPKKKPAKIMPYETETKRFEKALKTKVGITTSSRGSGKITIKFKNTEDFQRLLRLLLGSDKNKA